MDITIGQAAGSQLAEVMAELLRERTLTRGRRAVARMEPALSENRLRAEEAIQRKRADYEELEMRAARVRYGLASLELESAQEKLDEAYDAELPERVDGRGQW